jgi:probable HAF family extracellular repeat protein
LVVALAVVFGTVSLGGAAMASPASRGVVNRPVAHTTVASSRSSLSGPAYTIKLLGITEPGGGWGPTGGPGSINNSGHIAGSYLVGPPGVIGSYWAGFIYDGTTLKQACALDWAVGLTADDTVFGTTPIKVKGKTSEKYVTCKSGVQIDSVLPYKAQQINIRDVNDNLLITGHYYYDPNNGSVSHAYYASVGSSTIHDIGTIGNANSEGFAINNHGTVVGAAGSYAFKFDPATDTSPVSLGIPAGWQATLAWDANDLGTSVGEAYSGGVDAQKAAYLWTASGQAIGLGSLPNFPNSTARAINNNGDVAGFAYSTRPDDGTGRAFLYTDGAMYDLNDLAQPGNGRRIYEVYAINDSGQMYGYETDGAPNFNHYAVRLDPVSPLHVAPVNTSPPTITGNPLSGYSVSGSPGSWTTADGVPAYTYQWRRCSASGDNCVDVPGATLSTFSMTAADLGSTLRLHVTATNPFGSSTADSAATMAVDTPLNAFAPQLWYDSQETYRADSAAEITDNCWTDGSNQLHNNYLQDNNGNPLASACDPRMFPNFPGLGQLALSFLGPNYAGSTYTGQNQALDSDYIKEWSDQVNDFQRMHAMPQYTNHIYGRTVPYSGDVVLQYWFWYYNQPNFVFHNLLGGHEGDWEGIQIHLNASGSAIDATYDQHGGGERCAWNLVTTSNLHPIVFVADNSHASYFRASEDPAATGNGEHVPGPSTPLTVEDISSYSPSSWLFWPGTWGGSHSNDLGAQASPTGPGRKGQQWQDPLAWQSSQNTCSFTSYFKRQSASVTTAYSATSQSAVATVPVPRISARRVGSLARISYCFANVPRDRARRPAVVETSVQSANTRVPPYTTQHRVQLPCGRVTQRVGRGHAPFHVLVSIWTTTGARSRTVTAPLR